MSTRRILAVGTAGLLIVGFGIAASDSLSETAFTRFEPARAAAITDTVPGDAIRARAERMFAPVPHGSALVADRGIPVELVELGRMLYMDPRLSSSWLLSCNTCHNLATAGVDLQATSIGHGWQAGPRNAPTVLNAVLHDSQFWDGRAADLAEQARGPMQASVEMNSDPDRVVRTVRSMPGYVRRFEGVYPSAEEPVTFERIARAIAAFETTLTTPNSRFDRYLSGDEPLDEPARRGLELFMTRGCASCHGGAALGGHGFFTFGRASAPDPVIRPAADRGRADVTGRESDAYRFKAPSLRNVAVTAPYFHTGAVWELDTAVDVMAASQLGIELREPETRAIVEFLEAQTGEMPRVEVPELPPATAATPRPDPR